MITTTSAVEQSVISKVCKMSNDELRKYINSMIDLVISGTIKGERLEAIKLEAKFAVNILNRRNGGS